MSILLRSAVSSLKRVRVQAASSVRTFADKKEEKFPDPIEHAVGEEKIMLILKEKGIDDPYYLKPISRDSAPGTKDKPYVVPSFEPKRMVGCVCEEDATTINYMWVHKGDPKRCECGYWFRCEDVPINYFDMVQKEIEAGILPMPKQ